MLHGMYQWCELVFVIHEGNKTFFFPKHCFIKALISIVISTHFPPYIMAWFLPRRWPNLTVFKKAWGQQTVGCETYKNSLGGRFWRIQVKANTIIEWMLWEFPHHFFCLFTLFFLNITIIALSILWFLHSWSRAHCFVTVLLVFLWPRRETTWFD